MIESFIYQDAIKRNGNDRSRFLGAVCGASRELRDQVEAMILTHERNSGCCGGETISLVLDRHQREPLLRPRNEIVPAFPNAGETPSQGS